MKHSIHLLRWSNSSFYNRQKDKRKEVGRLHGTNGELLVADDHGAPADAGDSQAQRHDPQLIATETPPIDKHSKMLEIAKS